jgi:hypothetical protein
MIVIEADSLLATKFVLAYQVCDTTKLCAQAKVQVSLALAVLNTGTPGGIG